MWSLNKAKCISCGECVKICPFQILELQDGYPQLKPDAKCIVCCTCADTCPEQAIELSIEGDANGN